MHSGANEKEGEAGDARGASREMESNLSLPASAIYPTPTSGKASLASICDSVHGLVAWNTEHCGNFGGLALCDFLTLAVISSRDLLHHRTGRVYLPQIRADHIALPGAVLLEETPDGMPVFGSLCQFSRIEG
jgi:hypothetical protein